MRRLLRGQSSRFLATVSHRSAGGKRHGQQSLIIRWPPQAVAQQPQSLWEGFSTVCSSRRLFSASAEAKTKDSAADENFESTSYKDDGFSKAEEGTSGGAEGEKPDESGANPEANAEAGEKEAEAKEEAEVAKEPELSPAQKLQKELEELTKKAAEKQNQVLLKLAEFENEKKKNQKIMKQRETVALSGFAREMTAVFEELDETTRIGQTAESPECVETLREGVVLTRDIFQNTLVKFGCQRENAEPGSPYKSQEQECVKEVESADLDADVVAEVISPGWTFDGQVLRKAKVAVVKAGPPTPPAPPNTQEATEEGVPSETKAN